MKKKNILYLDVLRIIATFAVIAIHVVTLYWNDYDVSTYEWGAFNVFDSISRWAVPIFCMISGYLFLNNEKKKLYIYKVTNFLNQNCIHHNSENSSNSRRTENIRKFQGKKED